MLAFVARLSLTAAVLTLVASSAQAQCPVVDGFSGPCCSPTVPNLPNFPFTSLPASTICWSNCAPVSQDCASVNLSPPVPIACGTYQAQFSLGDCAGIALMSGLATLDYTRTWMERDTAGQIYQVWRFAVRADLGNPGVVTPGCAVPPCVGTWGDSFYYGYIDYVLDCVGAGFWQQALVLFHNCDAYIHNQSSSSEPGTFHPGRSYAIVAPDSTVNPFVPSDMPAPGGALVGEATRTLGGAAGVVCLTEDPIASGSILPAITGCGCPLSFLGVHNTARIHKGAGTCPDATGVTGSYTSIDTFPYGQPWFHNLTTSIGCWSMDATYPGKECVWVDEGVYGYRDVCVGTNYLEWQYGATTDFGWMIVPDPTMPTPTQRFTDLSSNYSAALPGPLPFPYVGTVLPSRHAIYTNY